MKKRKKNVKLKATKITHEQWISNVVDTLQYCQDLLKKASKCDHPKAVLI